MCIRDRLTTDSGPFVVVTVYRPGFDHLRTQFFDEMSTLLEMAVVYACPVLVGGDFNIKTQSSNDPGARRLADLLTSFDMVQHVRGPTQRRGNTLDVVVTPANAHWTVPTLNHSACCRITHSLSADFRSSSTRRP